MKPFDSTGAFRFSADGMARMAARGAGATMLSSGLAVVLQIASTMILSRLLLPADFGIVTMITTFSLLPVNFGLNGFTEVVLQTEDITHGLISNLFWINVGGGAFISVAFAATGRLLARFYSEPHLVAATAGLAPMIFFTSTSVLHLALLKRGMKFGAVSINDAVARVVSLTLAIGLAWAGWNYWALVAGAVASPFCTTIGAWWMCRWIPGRPRRVPGTAAAVRFATHVYGRFGVNYCARNMDNLLVGWRFQAQALGFYKKAYDLFAISAFQIVAPLTNVAVSALSRVRGDLALFKRYFLSTVGVVAFLGMGLGAYLALIGKDLIRLLLGPNWAPAGEIFMWFGPGIGAMMVYSSVGWIHLSIGRADRWFRWSVVEFVFTGLLFLFGLRWGPVGIAAAWTASFWILTLPSFWYAGAPIGLGVGPVLNAVWKYLAASAAAGSACALILPSHGAPSEATTALVHLAQVSALFTVLYVAAVVVLHGGGEPLYRIARLVREMTARRESSQVPEATPTCDILGA